MSVMQFTGRTAFRRKRRMEKSWQIARAITFILAIIIALASYRYIFDDKSIPNPIDTNAFRPYWLAGHAILAATALLVGVMQFSRTLRERKPSFHRRVGRIYVLSCIFGAISGFVLAVGASSGPVVSAGFGLLAIIWLITTALGWKNAWERRFAAHRRWMIRSWALTLAAVTLRLYIPIAEMAGFSEDAAYRAISFLCWVPNLIIAELLLRKDASSRTTRGVAGERPLRQSQAA